MRRARLVGLSPDGRFLVVATDSGEELAVAADDRLRAALRGDRPRLGQLEIEMDSALSPREIQSRIRSGQSLEDVARAAGVPAERVERFAAPVIAERDHVARMAMASSVRRRGETSAHRTLQATLTERLRARGVDLATLDWDAYRLEDGRWAVTADYRSGEAARRAEFRYDTAGRFSVAGNDEARWVLGEQSAAKGPQPGRRRPDSQPGDTDEPTLDLSDELALVRAIQDEPPPPPEPPLASVQQLHPPEEVGPEPDRETAPPGPIAAAPPDSHDGPSDAVAVPETVSAGWEPAIVVRYPVEPGPVDTPGPPDPIVSGDDRLAEAAALAAEYAEDNGAGEPAGPDVAPPEPTARTAPTESTKPTAPEEPAAEVPPVPERGKTRRKRAEVPSWDEIMFGGPKRSS